VVSALSGPVIAEPLVACAPLQPPDAVQLVAFVLCQDRPALPPAATCSGEAVRDTEIAGGGLGGGTGVMLIMTCCEMLPPAPLQASV
jgi:hypothetical protein